MARRASLAGLLRGRGWKQATQITISAKRDLHPHSHNAKMAFGSWPPLIGLPPKPASRELHEALLVFGFYEPTMYFGNVGLRIILGSGLVSLQARCLVPGLERLRLEISYRLISVSTPLPVLYSEACD
jgi:hypothetical protein